VRYYTPINEIFICASFSALRGFWNEALADEKAFGRAIRNMCMGHELAIEAILAERPDAIFVQSESIEHFHAATPKAEHKATRENAFKHLSLDLTLGRELEHGMASFLQDCGVTSNDLSFFRERRAVGQRWLGLDYYPTCEHRIASTGRSTTSRKPFGFRYLASEYYSRYRIPLFHCETNRVSNHAVDWLSGQWDDITALRRAGVPVMGFTWFSLTDQIDWQYALRVERNDVYPVGLYDLERRIRPVGIAYRQLIEANRDLTMLPTEAEVRAREA
jgi:beta-glucosidase/6-phospho-beta-glucosidase/beta-galactosidase